MGIVLDAVVSASLSGSVIIVLILLLRLVLNNAPKRYICLLWLLAAVRLLVPLNIESGISLQPNTEQVLEQLQEAVPHSGISDSELQVPVATVDHDNPNVQLGDADMESPENAVIGVGNWESDGGIALTIVDWNDVKFRTWALVLFGFLGYTVVSYGILKRKVRNAIAVDEGVYESDAITAPFLLGYLQPNIYLPVGLTPGDMEHILAHERVHIRRGDNWTKLVMFLCLAVHWFNPLVWVAYVLLCKDMEMACDEEVIRDMPLEARKSYSRALVNCAAHMGMISACPVAFGEVSVKDRILKVLSYRKPVFWLSVVAVVTVVFVAVCFLTSPMTPEPLTGMAWLQSLDAEEVASVRFAVGENPASYTDYAPEELAEVVAFLRSCDGAESTDGSILYMGLPRSYFYITMTDGTVLTLVHQNDYVMIGDVIYDQCDDWLAQWPEEGRVQVDVVERMLAALEAERTREIQCVYGTAADGVLTCWRRSGENWYKQINADGENREYLLYNGQRFFAQYRYVGPSYLVEGHSWKESETEETFDLPWPLNEMQDPADYTYVDAAEFEGQNSVTLRYEPDGTLVRFTYWGDGWLVRFEVESPESSVETYSFMDPSSAGSEYLLLYYYQVATGQFEGYPQYAIDPDVAAQWKEQVRLALADFQSASVYSLMQSDTVSRPGFEDSTLLVWNSGDNWLRQYQAEVSTDYYLQYEGKQYHRYASSYMTSDWSEAELSEEENCRDSWLKEFYWDAENIYCSGVEEREGQTWVSLFEVDDTVRNGYYSFTIVLNEQGQLAQAYKSWADLDGASYTSNVAVYYHGSAAVESYIIDAYREAVGE